jgi:hypothetical protein
LELKKFRETSGFFAVFFDSPEVQPFASPCGYYVVERPPTEV